MRPTDSIIFTNSVSIEYVFMFFPKLTAINNDRIKKCNYCFYDYNNYPVVDLGFA